MTGIVYDALPLLSVDLANSCGILNSLHCLLISSAIVAVDVCTRVYVAECSASSKRCSDHLAHMIAKFPAALSTMLKRKYCDRCLCCALLLLSAASLASPERNTVWDGEFPVQLSCRCSECVDSGRLLVCCLKLSSSACL